MKIRAITYFCDLKPDPADIAGSLRPALTRAGAFLRKLVGAYTAQGIIVQTVRLATQPYPQFGLTAVALPDFAQKLAALTTELGITYTALGPVTSADDPAYLDILPDIFAAAEGIFASIEIANAERGIDLGLLRRSARIIQRTASLRADGLANLYLAASANVPAGTPFFPAAYHAGGADRVAFAIESADLAVEAFTNAETPNAARDRLKTVIDSDARRLAAVAEPICRAERVGFGGLDFSLAPYPGAAASLAGAMERLGVTAGGSGMVAAASLVMNAIEAVNFPRCGFSGLMLPVLEDTTLGERAGQGALHVNDLLLYSAVCGTGLDCIPLPGATDEATLAGILLDTAALALRLNKPLTARLMPLPGKSVGDEVVFPTFEYFVASRVMQPPTGLSAGALGGSAAFNIMSRRT